MRTVSRTDRASRLIKAPASQVYRAFIDPAALVRWLPPEGMTGEMLAFDARPGGGYRMALHHGDTEHATPGKTSEHSDVVETRFVSLNPGRGIVQSAVFDSEDPAFAGTMRMTWTFEPAEGGTRVAITCEDVPQGIRKQDHLQGLKSSLANLAAFVGG
ncbi:SRPBCC family protein [Nostoc ellipsosporum NOK]|uniref:SRPBCC family protein n=1 Tax=Sphingomonas sp. IBVSS2 TaxID=1985172 RepID=UPI000A2D45FF|nr:SRPBCC family protein [Sphingomonas sp. IBVSS2]MDF2383201.1 SRPBCC family protein [Nostoc ellipsosporum NOK]OSZ69494.1 ATPase [Sphingomonas sp. IBVSS2]